MKNLNIEEVNKSFNIDDYSIYLQKQYNRYVRYISTKGMTASMVCCTYFLHLINELDPSEIIDFGSGFSSFAIRKFKQRFAKDFKCCSVDSDPLWLMKTSKFCTDNKVDNTSFFTWDNVKRKKFDLIFFDIDLTYKRVDYFEDLFNDFCKKGTIILFDDMHKAILENRLRTILKDRNDILYDTKKITLDGRRFSYLVEVR